MMMVDQNYRGTQGVGPVAMPWLCMRCPGIERSGSGVELRTLD